MRLLTMETIPYAALAVISGSSLINAVIMIIVAAVIWYLLNWLIGVSGIGDPFARVARVILAVLVVIFLVNALLSLVGHPLISW